jgi:hypothetical protein
MFTSSCNAASHVSVPNAPHLTAYLQFAKAPDADDQIKAKVVECFNFVDPDTAGAIYPDIDFSLNSKADLFIRTCPAGDEVRVRGDLSALGAWARPYLRRLRVNQILPDSPEQLADRKILLPEG